MPVLPLIDLLILCGWTCLAVGGVLKAIIATTSYQPQILSMGPMEFLIVAVTLLLFALTLAARTWVKMNEPQLTAKRRALSTLQVVSTEGGGFDYESDREQNSTNFPPSGAAGS